MNHVPAWLIPILVSGGVGLGLSILGKLMPVAKIMAIADKWGNGCAVALEAVLLRWFPLKTEQQVEEGVFCTLAAGVVAFCNAFINRIKSNNVKAE
jgi:hypothetical protein